MLIYILLGFFAGFIENAIYELCYDEDSKYELFMMILLRCVGYGLLSSILWPLELPLKMLYQYKDKWTKEIKKYNENK